jgi:2-oxoglutarate dehydrogenase E1 component
MKAFETYHAEFIEDQYQRWRKDPQSVPSDWQHFFSGFEIAREGAAAGEGAWDEDRMLQQARVEALKYRYRDMGHLLACMDPLEACPIDHPLLSLGALGLKEEDLDTRFFTRRFADDRMAPLKAILQALKETYCRSIGVEYMHLQDPEERRWLQERMEPVRNQPDIKPKERLRILERLFRAALFEQFLNRKYVGVTRFSLEGGDGLIPMLDDLLNHAAAGGGREVVLGMAHRGRLNVQTHILDRPYEDIFSEFEHCYDPDALVGAGDVKYHNGYLADLTTADDRSLRVFLVNNPSHLEAVDPVVEGIARARQDLATEERHRILPLLIHGDAAFAGQGVVAETLNMSQLAGYATGGTLHIVINNQIGYTTLPKDARSTRYSTDVAKMLMVPVFHVHGENPEALLHVARMACDYRSTFSKDAVIDLVCYRRYGHNEGDEPYFTQPRMYSRIRRRTSLHKLYAERLVEAGLTTKAEVADMEQGIRDELEQAYARIHDSECPFPQDRFFDNWEHYESTFRHDPVPTGVSGDTLIRLARALREAPSGFKLNEKLVRLMDKRLTAVENGTDIDWANAESLAWASLLVEGTPVRLSGQDCARGTFSQRHGVWIDTQSGDQHVPLNALTETQAVFEVYNSQLAEYSVLGFEYGYAMMRPEALVMWEAQFGDFVNNAQSIIDLFIASGESKWRRLNGLVLLLPHGFEGQGPEHSSARLERFLQLCADDNMQVCYPTTPAQYFHLLRRQVHQNCRKPLIVMTPKSLLRHPKAVSRRDDLTEGYFTSVLDDQDTPAAVPRLVFCSGKIYYELLERRRSLGRNQTALIRLEQIYPFPGEALGTVIARYDKAREFLWVQEEPENMGAWQFVRPRLEGLLAKPLRYVGRSAAASPATGYPKIFRRHQDAIINEAVGIEDADRAASAAANYRRVR